ncbi:hypothetical protein [Microcoleus sp. Pol12B4]|uniref:hypothetical protein n=1 Tax=Microcoleus sp. Pol12B4 TaxID=3055395 RepID=UPI002FD3676D
MNLVKENQYKKKRFQILCCIYTFIESNPRNEIKVDELIKHPHLKKLSERDILNGVDFLKNKGFIVWDFDSDLPSGYVWVTSEGIKEIESNIETMLDLIEHS